MSLSLYTNLQLMLMNLKKKNINNLYTDCRALNSVND